MLQELDAAMDSRDVDRLEQAIKKSVDWAKQAPINHYMSQVGTASATCCIATLFSDAMHAKQQAETPTLCKHLSREILCPALATPRDSAACNMANLQVRQKLKQARELQRRQLPMGAAPIHQAPRAVSTLQQH